MSFFFPNVDEIVSVLFGPFYFFTRILTTVKAGKLSDEFHGLWISGLLPSECLEILPVSLFSPPRSISWLFYGAQLSWEADRRNKKYIQDHLHTVMTALNCILYSLKNVKV